MAAFYYKPVSALNYSPILIMSIFLEEAGKKKILSCQGFCND